MMEKKEAQAPILSNPALPVNSGAVVPPEADAETRRRGMDRNRALLMVGTQIHGSGFFN